MQTADHADYTDCIDCTMFLCAFFFLTDFTCDYSFGNIGTVSNFWTLHDEILGYFEQPILQFYCNACTVCVK